LSISSLSSKPSPKFFNLLSKASMAWPILHIQHCFLLLPNKHLPRKFVAITVFSSFSCLFCFLPSPLHILEMTFGTGNRWYIGIGNWEKFNEEAIYIIVARVKGNQQGILKPPMDKSSWGMSTTNCIWRVQETETDGSTWREL
jgi:hypothetical protein